MGRGRPGDRLHHTRRELFGLDLDDPDTRLSSWLQLRIGAGNAGRSKSWPAGRQSVTEAPGEE
ncbi:hypothetical protein ACFTWD_03830 [Streptomyces sp. NPDC056943]|uniref:hypothetical protein n=1 Tax=Streptomyces sp. NPDC056943 TaxID=3345971 RepID=UPI003639B35F